MRNPVIRGGVSRGVKRGGVVPCAVPCTYSKGKASRHLAALLERAEQVTVPSTTTSLVMELACRASADAAARSTSSAANGEEPLPECVASDPTLIGIGSDSDTAFLHPTAAPRRARRVSCCAALPCICA